MGKGAGPPQRWGPCDLLNIVAWLLEHTPAGSSINASTVQRSSRRGGKMQQFRRFCGRSSPRSIWIPALQNSDSFIFHANLSRHGVTTILLPCCTVCRRLIRSIFQLQLWKTQITIHMHFCQDQGLEDSMAHQCSRTRSPCAHAAAQSARPFAGTRKLWGALEGDGGPKTAQAATCETQAPSPGV